MPHVEPRRAFFLVLIAIATSAAAAACGSSPNRPDTQPAPREPTATPAVTSTRSAAAPKEFVSTRYHFRVTLTTDWSENDAQFDWDGRQLQGTESPAFANFSEEDRTLVAAAARSARGTQLAEWRAAMVRAAPSGCSESSSVKKTTLDGEPALAWTATCSDGADVNKLAALHEKLGYMIFLPSHANDNAVDWRIFESIRRSFRFIN